MQVRFAPLRMRPENRVPFKTVWGWYSHLGPQTWFRFHKSIPFDYLKKADPNMEAHVFSRIFKAVSRSVAQKSLQTVDEICFGHTVNSEGGLRRQPREFYYVIHLTLKVSTAQCRHIRGQAPSTSPCVQRNTIGSI